MNPIRLNPKQISYLELVSSCDPFDWTQEDLIKAVSKKLPIEMANTVGKVDLEGSAFLELSEDEFCDLFKEIRKSTSDRLKIGAFFQEVQNLKKKFDNDSTNLEFAF